MVFTFLSKNFGCSTSLFTRITSRNHVPKERFLVVQRPPFYPNVAMHARLVESDPVTSSVTSLAVSFGMTMDQRTNGESERADDD